MADTGRMPRTRGVLSGLLLILLGAWGALAPFVGPYFHYAYTPDRAWAYTSGRLWLQVAPGLAAVLGGLVVLASRSRVLGGLFAFLAALGGAWFVAGAAVTAQLVKNGSINPGVPVGTTGGAGATSLRQFLEGLGFFTGTGVLIVFFAALALGRFAQAATADSSQGGEQEPFTGRQVRPDLGDQRQYPTTPEQYPTTPEQYPTTPEQYPTTPEQYPPAGSPSSSAAGQVPEEGQQGPAAGQAPAARDQVPASTDPPAQAEPFPASAEQFPSSAPPDQGRIQF